MISATVGTISLRDKSGYGGIRREGATMRVSATEGRFSCAGLERRTIVSHPRRAKRKMYLG